MWQALKGWMRRTLIPEHVHAKFYILLGLLCLSLVLSVVAISLSIVSINKASQVEMVFATPIRA